MPGRVRTAQVSILPAKVGVNVYPSHCRRNACMHDAGNLRDFLEVAEDMFVAVDVGL